MYATDEDWSRVAAQVQEETTAEETRPDFTVRPAVLKTSEVWSSLLYRLRTNVVNIMPKLFSVKVSRVADVSILEEYSREQEAQTDDNAIASGLAERRCCRHGDAQLCLRLKDSLKVLSLYIVLQMFSEWPKNISNNNKTRSKEQA